MTWFNFVKKDIVLHCYTSRAEVFNYAPIKKASNYIPEWWKALPKTHREHPEALHVLPTMKLCVGFTNLFAQGFILPLWSEVAIKVGKQTDQPSQDYSYQFADLTSQMGHHAAWQSNDAYPSNQYQHLKIISPWALVCDEDIAFMQLQPVWNFSKPEEVFIPPGVLNFKYQSATNINMFYKRQAQDIVHTLEFGQPMSHLVPLTERKVRLELHLVSDEDFKKLDAKNKRLSFFGKYRQNKNALTERKCPFHFKT